jgi:hypothetical protein
LDREVAQVVPCAIAESALRANLARADERGALVEVREQVVKLGARATAHGCRHAVLVGRTQIHGRAFDEGVARLALVQGNTRLEEASEAREAAVGAGLDLLAGRTNAVAFP